MKGRALRRALRTADAVRISVNVPLLSDSTELIDPERAEELLKANKRNRPVNWRKVEEYSRIMREGKWKLHSQGIILDANGNILTGQTRLWAVVFSDTPVYMRVSRGNSPEVAKLLDRGRPQSARDLATRDTQRKHSPTEATIARALLAMRGNVRPSTDEISDLIVSNSAKASAVTSQTIGTKKTKSVLMILAAICENAPDPSIARALSLSTEMLSQQLEKRLSPQSADKCWGKGAAFSLAMEVARFVVREELTK